MTMESVLKAVADNRSLWVELECAEHQVPAIDGVTPVTDPLHCTLTFHGKGCHEYWVRRLHEEIGSMRFDPFDARVSGIARFRGNKEEGDPLVLLVSDMRIRRLKEWISFAMNLPTSTDWDYTPHITLGRVAQDVMVIVPPVILLNQFVHFTSIAICAGEERVLA